MAKKIELLHTTYDESGNVESQEVVHPLTSPDCIIMENGKTLDEVMGDGIATPTLTHEGTSFKVGVGDSNIEVVDGDVAGMTLKGQSYQNILPKPTTLIMETDEQEFKINDKIDSNIIIDDNIAEIATIKGKTIVNAVQEESGSEYTVLGEDLSGQSIVSIKDVTLQGQTLVNLAQKRDSDFNVNIEANKNAWSEYWRLSQTLVKGKKYFIAVTVVENTMATGRQLLYINNGKNQDNQYSVLVMNQRKGYLKSVFTANFDALNTVCVARESHTTDGILTIKNNLILCEYQEGMENWDIPYFEGEKYFESNIKGVTLQGQTLVNAIQEPCENDYVVLGADDGIEISAETGGCGTIEDTIQGGINGAILKGQTFVNLCKGSWWNSHVTSGYDIVHQLKANTKYIILINSTENIDNISLAKSDYTPIVFGEREGNTFKFTTPSNTEELVRVRILLSEKPSSEPHYEAILLEYQGGMENWNIPYFEGMQSVEQPVLTTTGKNLLNEQDFKAGGWIVPVYENGKLTFTPTDSVRSSANFQVNLEKGKQYVLSFHNITGNANGISNDINIHTLSDISTPLRTIKNKTPFTWNHETGSYYIRPFSYYTTANTISLNIQLEENSVVTTYEPYKSTTVTTEKNLFDGILALDYLADATGQPSGKGDDSSARCRHTPSFIPIKANEKFRLRATSDGSTTVGDGKVYFYDKDYNYLNITILPVYTDIYRMDAINTVPNNSNIAYMRVRFFNGFGVQADSVQINKVYELRGIGDVKDELDLTTGKLTQRIGEVVLDGSEDWEIHESYTNEYRINFVLNRGEIPSNCKFICNQYVTTTLRQEDTLTDYMYVGNLNINVFTKPNTTLDEFKLQLQSNPLILQYPLATPIIKTIDLQVTNQDGKTIPHIQTQPTVTHITASSDYLIPTVTIDNNLAYDTIIKPSTLYTVRFKHDIVNADNPLTVDLGGTVQTVTSTEFTITTPSTLTHNQLVFSGKNNVVSEVQVIEGDVTNIEYPFFEGMNDVRITNMTRNVNLFDINDTVSGYFNVNGGIESPDFGNLISNYIKVKPNTTYVYNHGGFVANFADYWTAIKFYKDDKGSTSTALQNTIGTALDKNGKTYYIGGGRYTVTGKTGYNTFQFTTPSDCEYIRIGSRGLSYSGAWVTLYQLDNFDDSKFIVRNCPFIFGKGGRI